MAKHVVADDVGRRADLVAAAAGAREGERTDTESLARRLHASFQVISDPRADRGRRHPLPATLTLLVLAAMDRSSSPCAAAEWGRRQPARLVAAMGFPRDQTPSGSTLRNVLGRLDREAFRRVLLEWAHRTGRPSGVDVALDESGLGFRIVRRPGSAQAPAISTTTTESSVKRVPQLRRWRHRD